MPEQRLSGVLRAWNDDRRFGFIGRDDGEPDIFVGGGAFDKTGRTRAQNLLDPDAEAKAQAAFNPVQP